MAAHVRVQLVEKMCEHCPSQERAWEWFFEIVGNQVVLVVRCKECEAQLIFTQKDMHGHLSVESIPSPTAPRKETANTRAMPAPEPPPTEPGRTVEHSRTFTPFDRAFMKKLGITTSDTEFEK